MTIEERLKRVSADVFTRTDRIAEDIADLKSILAIDPKSAEPPAAKVAKLPCVIGKLSIWFVVTAKDRSPEVRYCTHAGSRRPRQDALVGIGGQVFPQ